jgi:hypothetical protein
LRSRRVSDRKCICHDDAAALLYSRSYFWRGRRGVY